MLCREIVAVYAENYTKGTHNTVPHLYCERQTVAVYAENYSTKETQHCNSLILCRGKNSFLL
jgi:hypothetical protein